METQGSQCLYVRGNSFLQKLNEWKKCLLILAFHIKEVFHLAGFKVLVSLPLHHIQLFLIEHSEAKLINILQVSSKDVKKLAVAKEGCQSPKMRECFLQKQSCPMIFFLFILWTCVHGVALYCQVNTSFSAFNDGYTPAQCTFQMGYTTRAERSPS